MIPALVEATGALPLGRYPATLDEVASRYATNDRRRKIWADFLKSTGMVRALATIHSVWLSGSYLTGKDQPGDIDTVYWVTANDPRAMQALVLMTRQHALKTSGLDVDFYALPYEPTPGHRSVGQRQYSEARGYWDDLWSRIKSTNPDIEKLIRRGYLEVIIDGYQPRHP
jgi:hypothetical protein